MKILLVGVGGVGCEFLYVLNELFNNDSSIEIAIVDDDLVEESNLSRQRLYTLNDIGLPKVQVAAERLKRTLSVFPIKSRIECIRDLGFFEQFDVFVGAVDNLEARRWLNSTVFQLKRRSFLLLDLGVQGLKLSIRTVRPGQACLECTFSLYSPEDDQLNIPVCSIYGQPRNLNDCVFWSLARCADRNDLQQIYDEAKGRADSFAINSRELSFEMIKRLMIGSIPAVASVNSLLASKGIELLIRFLRGEKGGEDSNFWMINLEGGYYEFCTLLERRDDCEVCHSKRERVEN